MPRKKVVDGATLVAAINSGMPVKEILAKFGIKTSTQLKSLYLDALVEQGTVRHISGRSKAGVEAQTDSAAVKVNKRGSVVVSRALVEEFGFSVGDCFTARRTKAGISLKKS